SKLQPRSAASAARASRRFRSMRKLAIAPPTTRIATAAKTRMGTNWDMGLQPYRHGPEGGLENAGCVGDSGGGRHEKGAAAVRRGPCFIAPGWERLQVLRSAVLDGDAHAAAVGVGRSRG